MRTHFYIRYAAICNIGNVRTNNEDNLFLDGIILTKDASNVDYYRTSRANAVGAVFAICDGMGGEEKGEDASLLAVRILQKYRKLLINPKNDLLETIKVLIYEANSAVCQLITDLGKRIGTTLALIVFSQNHATIANLGDSRVFLFRNNELKQLSVDHTQAQTLIRSGALTEEEAKIHPSRNKLTQHLGIFSNEIVIEPHVMLNQEIHNKDSWLICSDGLTDLVTSDEITRIFITNRNVQSTCKALVNIALKRGAHDNVTSIVIKAEKHRFFDSLFK